MDDKLASPNEDVINQMNYNTITSLAALKDLLGDQSANVENDEYFQHYFMNYCNSLPSRNDASPSFIERRRLSQCREEDEDEDAVEPRETTSNTVQGPKRKFIVTKTTAAAASGSVQSERVPDSTHTVHFGTRGAESSRPNVRNIFNNLHKDVKYMDNNITGIKPFAKPTINKLDDVWIKRPDARENNSIEELDETESPEENIARSGSWSSQSKPTKTDGKKKKEQEVMSKSEERRRAIKEQRKRDREMSSSTHSVRSSRSSSQETRTSEEDNSHAMYQHTIHGTTGVSRRPALFNAFFTKKNDNKKQPSLMQQVKAFMGHSKHKSPSSTPNSETSTPLPTETAPTSTSAAAKTRDGSAHPYAGGSDTRYYHTVTAATSRRPSAMAKVMDIFRAKPSLTSSSDAASRKAKALAQQQFASTHIRRSTDPSKRRSSLGNLPIARHRASDAAIDPYHAAILFRDARGLPVVDPFLERMTDLDKSESQIFLKFFKYHKCYDLIPTSAKLVIIDTQLPVKKVFFAFVYNGVRAAPLWDSQRQRFIGMITVTDFIKILQMFYKNPNVAISELEEHNTETWRLALKGTALPLISIAPDASLYDAIKTLITNKIHRLPILDPHSGDILYILTHKRIIKFLYLYINELPKPDYLNLKLEDLKIGTYDNIELAREDTTIIQALTKFVTRRISALPIVDCDNKLKDIYAKFDVINLAAEKTYNNLDVTLKKANEYRNEWFEGVEKCKMSDTLNDVLEKIVKTEVHRLVVVNHDDEVVGIVSLSDLLDFLVLRPKNEFIKLLNEIKLDILALDKDNETDDECKNESSSIGSSNLQILDENAEETAVPSHESETTKGNDELELSYDTKEIQ